LLIAATLILPVLAYAGGGGNSQGGGGNNNSQGNSVPDGGPGIVLLATTIGAVLLFSTRGHFRPKAAQK
jgi:hypothetical protein